MSAVLRDIGLLLRTGPGSLAEFGEVLGAARVSLEGGGVFTHQDASIAHFLVNDADTAVEALDAHGMGPVVISDVVMLRLDQETPGQLGAFTRTLADAGIEILVQYSDHDHRLVLIVPPDQHLRAAQIASAWDAR
ncbi:hypothetical protein [Microbacterium sp. A84]|uniref:hypothetical protein n=1 Tax=Microbacterium sp. A84 TaxID=3450715 RepID=UPI003F420787